MNGHHKTSGGDIIIEKHNENLRSYKFEQIKLNPKKELDHRKMLCFFTSEKGSPDEITLEKIDDFLEKIYIGAILIGSSNQSKTTYFSSKASKGEADVFMFDTGCDQMIEACIKPFMAEDQTFLTDIQTTFTEDLKDVVIAKSFFGKGHAHTQEFLKSILKDVLENGLEK